MTQIEEVQAGESQLNKHLRKEETSAAALLKKLIILTAYRSGWLFFVNPSIIGKYLHDSKFEKHD